jgi:hypothetical protein
MEKNNRIAQAYGYLVCLVTVITLLISISNLFNALINLQDPLHAETLQTGSGNLASYEEYRFEKIRNYQQSGDSLTKASVPDAKELRQMYDDQRNNHLQSVKLKNVRSLVAYGMLLLASVILFIVHWRWLRRMARSA